MFMQAHNHLLSLTLTTLSIITLMIIENRALWLARSFALSRYNHRAVIIAWRLAVFKMAARFFDVSESEIDQYFCFLE